MALFKNIVKKINRLGCVDTQPTLNQQFRVTLHSLYLKLKAKRNGAFKQSPETSTRDEKDRLETDAAIQRIDVLFAEPDDWAGSCEIELLLLYLYDEPAVEAELRIRLSEAECKLPAHIVESYRQGYENGTIETKRALLGRLVSDLQWHQTNSDKMLLYKQEATRYISALFLLSFISFLVMVFHIENTAVQLGSITVIGIVITSGFWGATFSLLTGMRKRLTGKTLEELKLLRRMVYMIARSMVGVGAATILFYVMQINFTDSFLSPNVRPVLTVKIGEDEKELLKHSIEAIVMREISGSHLNSKKFVLEKALQQLINEVETAIRVSGFDVRNMLQQEVRVIVNILYDQGYMDLHNDQAKIAKIGEEQNETQMNPLTHGNSGYVGKGKHETMQILIRELEDLVMHERAIDRRSLALIIMWSFLAGFSEKLVPNLLSKTEEKITDQ